MNTFLFTGFFMGAASLFLGVLLLKYGTNKIHYTFAFQNIGIAIWGFSNGFAGLAKSSGQALIWWEIGHTAAFYLIVLLVHHALLINNLKQRILLLSLYVWATIFPVLCFFGISGMRIKYTYLKYAFISVYFPKIETFIFWTYVVMWVLLAGYVIVLIAMAYRKSTGSDRRSLKVYRFAYPIGLLGGGSYPFMLLGINLLYPYSQLLVPLYCGLMTYSIMRHKLFNIEVIIKKTLVFTGLLTVMLGVIVAISFILQTILGKYFAMPKVLSYAVMMVVVISLYEPVKKFLVRVTDKFLFQEKYGYRQILQPFIDDVITVLDLNTIVNRTIELLVKTLHPEKIAILLLDDDGDRFVSHQVVGYDGKLLIEKNSAIPTYLMSSKDIFSTEGPNNGKVNEDLIAQMKEYYARLAIPLFMRDELVGIILLGKKKSDEYYTSDDMSILSDLAKAEAVAINNSKIHALLLQAQQKEEQSNRLLSLAYLVTNLAHELRNPLQLIKGSAKLVIDNITFKAKNLSPDEKYQNFLSYVLNKQSEIVETSQKTSGMLESILGSMRIDKSKFTPVNIRNVVHEAIKRAEVDAQSANIKLLNNIPHDFVNINGDHITLEQVFFNLIHNAVEAMIRSGKGDRIEITAFNMDKKVKIEVADNGPGVPKHDLCRIFEPFYTTKENLYKYASGKSKGTGLGLTIVDNNIKSHGGAIHVKSEEGRGTTFVIELPKDGGISNGGEKKDSGSR